ncbi:conserved Plasmodium protein, unknown function [Plasmodium chabaudi chabaudi]|uniref:50S ribosomal protein L29 n=1 Tax=Plasmodium chabaudi chabaudi TaxID=31271 RepID=A0A077TP01_PLACU|nr:conserved Plasmodium protein, unknown function [Plasmodium chabaudi chabaudi]SCM21311.1 conserved Plasmodium protein, unknown function [Plasmodium chabaudi chabaudi]VTZ68439.1 conserved Plasmodium protein, unknown function [Plasmodium chabaudi chabaudi]|eukprot:XP_740515.2 conserved Plasmodium protein, unknown function [Plasmodium chabaudi chabaudi]
MLNLSSLLIKKKSSVGDELNSADKAKENGEGNANDNNDSMKIKLINMKDYKTKKLLDERKNVKAWAPSPTNKKGNKSEKKKEKQKDKPADENKKTDEKKEEKKEPAKKIFVPSIIKQKAVVKKENEKEELFPNLLQAKKSTKIEKDEKKNAPQKKKKKEKASNKPKEEENQFPPIEEIKKINFNVFDVVDIKNEYERIVRDIDKVTLKYKNKKKFDNTMILCN